MSFSKPKVIFLNLNPLYFLAQTSHTFCKSSPSKRKFSDFPLPTLRFTKFLMSFFKQKNSFSSKFACFSRVMRDNSSVLFQMKLYMFLIKVALHQSAYFQTCYCSHYNSPNSSCHFWNQGSVFLETLHHTSVSRDNSSVLFQLTLYIILTKGVHQSANFQTLDCSHEN